MAACMCRTRPLPDSQRIVNACASLGCLEPPLRRTHKTCYLMVIWYTDARRKCQLMIMHAIATRPVLTDAETSQHDLHLSQHWQPAFCKNAERSQRIWQGPDDAFDSTFDTRVQLPGGSRAA